MITINELSNLTVTPFEAVVAVVMLVGMIVFLYKVNKFEQSLYEEMKKEGRD